MAKYVIKIRLLRALVHVERHTDRPWFIPLVALGAGADFFIIIIPTDMLLVSATLMRPRRWIWNGIWVAFGSAVGAALLGAAVLHWGEPVIRFVSEGALESEAWQSTRGFVDRHGFWAMAALALGPFPLHPAVIVASVAKVPVLEQFAAYFLGRGIKYLFFSWVASHAPSLITRFTGKPHLPKKKAVSA